MTRAKPRPRLRERDLAEAQHDQPPEGMTPLLLVLLTSADVAAALSTRRRNVSANLVNRARARINARGDAPPVGQLHGREWIYTAADLPRLAAEIRPGRGNPLMGAEQPEHYRRRT